MMPEKIPNSIALLREDFALNSLEIAKLLLRISKALDYEQVEMPDGMIAAILKMAAEKLEEK
jgi:hypothetical protein